MEKHQPTKQKAGVVLYRCENGDEVRVLVVSARKFSNQWVFPVGTVKKGESLRAAARRECEEESGYQVELGLKLPAIQISQKGKTISFTFFLATINAETESWEPDRIRRWVPLARLMDTLPAVFQGVARQAVEQIRK
jgi:8-oxo-dGTP pyrophosphatase MutT (NUDIX family)